MLTNLLVFLTIGAATAHAENIVHIKLRERAAIMGIAAPQSPFNKESNNPSTPAYFLGILPMEMQTDMNVLQTFAGVDVAENNWSGYYWPNYVGGLGFRYNDRYFPKGKWSKSLRYVKSKPSASVSADNLSPSEKYDIVMGVSPEEPGSLTSRQWSLAKAEFEDTGKVETWQGICNGWAAASINFAAPQHPVTLPSSRGDITFQTEDIKALGSLLYATGRFESVFTGLRCNTDEPEGRGDRVTQPECFDINPADWHLLVTHQLGMNKRPFIIDYINSKEVWNKPIVGYSLRYFDIKRRSRFSDSFRDVVRPSRKVYIYREFRAPKTEYVVGVRMIAKLLFGANEDSHVGQTFKSIEYSYMLEMDKDYKIIGGEWFSEKHPDFAWQPKTFYPPMTDGDILVKDLDPTKTTESSSWREASLLSVGHGAPLSKFVINLFNSAQ